MSIIYTMNNSCKPSCEFVGERTFDTGGGFYYRSCFLMISFNAYLGFLIIVQKIMENRYIAKKLSQEMIIAL